MNQAVDRSIADGAKAQAIAVSGITNELLDQADAVLDRLVSAHAGGTLTDRDAAVGVATISELRRAAGKQQRAMLKGTTSAATLTMNGAKQP